MRRARLVVGIVASALAAPTPAARLAVIGATALSGSGCSTCTVDITTPDPLPDGRVGQAYFLQMRADHTGANCDSGPVTWWGKDTLPPGMKVSEDGALDGTPTRAGTYSFQITVLGFGANTSRQYSLTILPP